MSRFLKYLLLFIFVLLGCWIVGGCVGSYLDYQTLDFGAIFTLKGQFTLVIPVVLIALCLLFFLLRLTDSKKGGLFKKTDKKKDKYAPQQFFDSKWLTEKEMDKKYPVVTFTHLGGVKAGIPLRAEMKGNDVQINMKYENWHALCIGTSGVGKSQCFINPIIQILGSCQDKPGIVVNDMKGELFRDHSEYLKSKGYNVITLNLRETSKSTRWNPMEKAFNAFQRSLHLYGEVKIHNNVNPADLGLQILTDVYNKEWFEFEGKAYPTKEMLDNDLKALKKQLFDEAYEDLNDIATTLCPISQGENASWDRGAKDFVLGVMLAMLEDSEFPELGMTKERFNLYNLSRICNFRDDDPDNQFASLQRYFSGRSKLSNAAQLANPVINNASTTIRGYLGIVSGNLSPFADGGVCFVTSGNEMDFEHFCDKPTAFFIQVPDEKDTRHAIAVMAIMQLYKILVATANKTIKQELPRRVFFVLDEFGNLPKIPKFDTIVTVARSRRISLFMAVQSYNQIHMKYGDAAADAIKSNCHIHYYMGTTDEKTKTEFSNRCGHASVETTSTSENKGKDSKQDTKSTSTSKTSVALITPDELGLLKEGEIIVSMFKESPMRVNFTPSWKAAQAGLYKMSPPPNVYVPARYLDEEKVRYDITERNKKVFRD